MYHKISFDQFMIHNGRNVARLRGLFQIPQKEMAAKLEILQQEYSRLEHKAVIDEDLLTRIASILNVPAQLIKTMDEENPSNVYFNESHIGIGFDYRKTDTELYERIIKEKEQQVQLMEQQLKMKDEMLIMKDHMIDTLKAQLKK